MTPGTFLLTRYNGIPVGVPHETFWLAYRGSIAHGMFVPSTDPNSIDDIDLMGFVFGSKQNYLGLSEWGSRGTREEKRGQFDIVLYEIRKAVQLLLQGNPNIMSMLWVDRTDMLIVHPAAEQLMANKRIFLGRHVYHAFAGYANQQLQKMETRDPAELRMYLAVTAELKFRGDHPNHGGERFPEPDMSTGEARDARNWDSEKLRQKLKSSQKKGESIGYMGDKRKRLVLEHGYDTKNAAHLIRLLRMCVEFFEIGEMRVKRPDAQELLEIKRGKWKLQDIKDHADGLFEKARQARDRTSMPEEPDYVGAEQLLVQILQDHLF